MSTDNHVRCHGSPLSSFCLMTALLLLKDVLNTNKIFWILDFIFYLSINYHLPYLVSLTLLSFHWTLERIHTFQLSLNFDFANHISSNLKLFISNHSHSHSKIDCKHLWFAQNNYFFDSHYLCWAYQSI